MIFYKKIRTESNHNKIVSLLCLILFMNIFFAEAEILPCNNVWFEGEGTQYGGVAGSEGGNCGIPVAEDDFYHCALNHSQYDSSRMCGACVRILGPKGEIILKVVDRCPECLYGDIDLSTEAFTYLAELKDGRIPIRWQYVPCEESENIKIFFAEGSGSYYFKAQFRNLKYPIVKVEYLRSDSSYVPIPREMYNYFVMQGGIDEDKSKIGPYSFRLTASTGEELIFRNIEFQANGEVDTGKQFSTSICKDCAGNVNGKAQIDNCGICSGRDTGVTPNSTCLQDCIGYWNGAAFLDSCGFCVGGTTGNTPCPMQPNGIDIPDNTDSFIYFQLIDLYGRVLLQTNNAQELRSFLQGKRNLFCIKAYSKKSFNIIKIANITSTR